jgi:hypothetical protein
MRKFSILLAFGLLGGCRSQQSAHDEIVKCSGYVQSMNARTANDAWQRSAESTAFDHAVTDTLVRELNPGSTMAPAHFQLYARISETYKAQMEPPRAERLIEEGDSDFSTQFSARDTGAIGHYLASCERAYLALSR